MRTAVLADIHGNLPALEATLADVAAAGADLVVLGGDIAAGPFPAETLDLLLAADRPVRAVRGNAENDILAAAERGGAGDSGDVWAERDSWVAAQLSADHLGFLRSLPKSLTEELAGFGPVCFCHGTPDQEDAILTPQTPDEDVRAALGGTAAPLVVCGHIHVQYDRMVGPGRRVVNAGSVGLPYEGDPAAFWALLDGQPGGAPQVQLRRTGYDVAATVRSMCRRDFPGAEEYATEMIAAPAGRDEAISVFESRRVAAG